MKLRLILIIFCIANGWAFNIKRSNKDGEQENSHEKKVTWESNKMLVEPAENGE